MGSTVIQEIAHQLGIAVDDTSSFIHQYLPQYANLQIFYNVMWTIMWVSVIVIIIFVARKAIEVYDDCVVPVMVIGGVGVAICICGLVISVGNGIGWAVMPEASLIDFVFNCLNCG